MSRDTYAFYRAVIRHVHCTTNDPCVRLTNRRFRNVQEARRALGENFIRLDHREPIHILVDEEGNIDE